MQRSVINAAGEVIVVGYFQGQATFGATTLSSVNNSSFFLAKWNPATASWVWAIQGVSTTGFTLGFSIGLSGNNIYITGSFFSGLNQVIAGTTLPGAGSSDMFLAKFIDNGASVANGWAVSGGGTGSDLGNNIAVSGNSVYVVGSFTPATNTRFAGANLTGAGNNDAFLAKYTDNGTTATGNWAVSGGGSDSDYGTAVAVSGTSVYLAGQFGSVPGVRFAGTGLTGNGRQDIYLAKYTDNGNAVSGNWAVGGGGLYNDGASGVAVSGNNVYIIGNFVTGSNAVLGGVSLPGVGVDYFDMFVAKFVDNGSSAGNGWVISEGTADNDSGSDIVASGNTVYTTGWATAGASIAGTALPISGASDAFVAKYQDNGASPTGVWAVRGGGTGTDSGYDLALQGNTLFMVGGISPPATFGTIRVGGGSSSVNVLASLVDGPLATLTGISPAGGVAGTSVTLTGTLFTGASAVSFNGVPAAGFTVSSATSITATVPAGATSGPVVVTTPGSTATRAFAVYQPSPGPIVVDGYREARYGAARALQTTPTGFGNATNGAQSVALGGSELDAAYAYVRGDSLYLFLAGNLENNGNVADVFFDSEAGGQNVLAATNPSVDNNGLNHLAGLTFDAGFEADYALSVHALANGNVSATFASLAQPGGFGVDPAATGTGRIVSLNLGNGRTGALALDNANTGGISDVAVGTGTPAAVVTGLEVVLPLSALGSPAGSLKVAAFLATPDHTSLSNQVLGGLPAGTPNLGSAAAVNFASTANAGNQYFSVPVPAILAFTPTNGPAGTVVTITGTGLAGATSVLFNGSAATNFNANVAGTQVTATVPAGATTGPITVLAPAGRAVSATAFTLTAPQLAVSQGTTPYPTNGAAYNFGNQVLNTTSAPVAFTLSNPGNGPLTLSSVSTTGNFAVNGTAPTSIPAGGTATVSVTFTPSALGSRTGALRLASALGTYVVNLAGTGTSAAPIISGVTPASAAPGATITVTGTGFIPGGTTATLNGVTLAGVSVNTAGTTLTFVLPAGATAGYITVTTAGGTATSTAALCVQYSPTGTPATRCGAGPVTLVATGAPASGTYAWYAQASGGTPLPGATGASYTNPALSATTTYYVAISTGAGAAACEGSRVAVTATVYPVPPQPTITLTNGGVLTSSSSTGNQWYLNGTAIPGATDPVYTVSTGAQLGTYTLVVTSADGCPSPTSAPQDVVVTRTTAPALAESLQVFPNPATGQFFLQAPAAAHATLYNSLGQVVQDCRITAGRTEFDVHRLASGVYSLHVQLGATTVIRRLVIR